MSYKDKMIKLFRQFEQENGQIPVSTNEVAAWAIENNLWAPRPQDVRKLCAADMADALRQEMRTDANGITYRAKHCVRKSEGGVQLVLWADIDSSAPRSFMAKSFAQRRRGIVDDCYQLKCDIDHFNNERSPEAPIQKCFDFTDDVAEREAADHAKRKKKAS